MPAANDFASYCAELLAVAGSVRSKRMFGGHGFYVDDLFVAIVVGDTLYLKADASNQDRFAQAGSVRFEYLRQGKRQTTGFWTVPAEALDSAASMRPWARHAVDAALRARTGRKRD